MLARVNICASTCETERGNVDVGGITIVRADESYNWSSVARWFEGSGCWNSDSDIFYKECDSRRTSSSS